MYVLSWKISQSESFFLSLSSIFKIDHSLMLTRASDKPTITDFIPFSNKHSKVITKRCLKVHLIVSKELFLCCQGCIGLIRWSVQSISVTALPGNALERSWRNAIKWQFKLTLVKFAEKIKSKCINVIASAIWNLSLIYSWWFFDPINSHLYSIWTKFSVVFELWRFDDCQKMKSNCCHLWLLS